MWRRQADHRSGRESSGTGRTTPGVITTKEESTTSSATRDMASIHKTTTSGRTGGESVVKSETYSASDSAAQTTSRTLSPTTSATFSTTRTPLSTASTTRNRGSLDAFELAPGDRQGRQSNDDGDDENWQWSRTPDRSSTTTDVLSTSTPSEGSSSRTETSASTTTSSHTHPASSVAPTTSDGPKSSSSDASPTTTSHPPEQTSTSVSYEPATQTPSKTEGPESSSAAVTSAIWISEPVDIGQSLSLISSTSEYVTSSVSSHSPSTFFSKNPPTTIFQTISSQDRPAAANQLKPSSGSSSDNLATNNDGGIEESSNQGESSSMTGGERAGIAIGTVIGIAFLIFCILYLVRLWRKGKREERREHLRSSWFYGGDVRMSTADAEVLESRIMNKQEKSDIQPNISRFTAPSVKENRISQFADTLKGLANSTNPLKSLQKSTTNRYPTFNEPSTHYTNDEIPPLPPISQPYPFTPYTDLPQSNVVRKPAQERRVSILRSDINHTLPRMISRSARTNDEEGGAHDWGQSQDDIPTITIVDPDNAGRSLIPRTSPPSMSSVRLQPHSLLNQDINVSSALFEYDDPNAGRGNSVAFTNSVYSQQSGHTGRNSHQARASRRETSTHLSPVGDGEGDDVDYGGHSGWVGFVDDGQPRAL